MHKKSLNLKVLFETYLMNRRALELTERKIESGFNIEVAKEFVNQNKSKFENIAKGTDKYNKQLCKLTSYLHTIALAYVASIKLSDPPQLL